MVLSIKLRSNASTYSFSGAVRGHYAGILFRGRTFNKRRNRTDATRCKTARSAYINQWRHVTGQALATVRGLLAENLRRLAAVFIREFFGQGRVKKRSGYPRPAGAVAATVMRPGAAKR